MQGKPLISYLMVLQNDSRIKYFIDNILCFNISVWIIFITFIYEF